MSYVQKEGQGSLFKNDKAGVETRPDYKGSINIGGQEFWLSAWLKKGEKGTFMSLSAQPKEQRQEAPRRPAPPPASKPASGFEDMDDDIPFVSASPQYDMVPSKARRMRRYDY